VTLAELLIAAALTAGVLGGVFTAAGPAQASFATEQERADLQQRLRVAVEMLTHDLRMAAFVWPYRVGAIADDAVAPIHFRPDTISLVFPAAVAIVPSEEVRRTYYLNTVGDVSQLMQYDGQESTFPVLDDVVALGFEYFGEPTPPRILPDDEPDDSIVPVTYGPAPPPMNADDPEDTWGTGENCTFKVIDGQQTPRLPSLGGRASAPLAAAILTDGPWCPDAAHADRFDADLLRIRRVRVRLRLQARTPFRGAAKLLFTHAGTASDVRRYVPDQEVRIDVAPRNWNAKPSP
jgi:hypothetical protein